MMKHNTRLAALLMALAMLLTMTACSKEPKNDAPVVTQAPAVADTAAQPAADYVMATVNGTSVTYGEYAGYLATMVTYYTNYGYDVSDPTFYAMLKQFALQTGVEYAVMNQKLTELGLALTDAEKEATMASAKEYWESQVAAGMTYYGITDESTEEERAATLVSVLAELEAMGYTEESYVAESVQFAGYDKLYEDMTKDVTVTEEAVINHYNTLVAADKAAYENDAAAYEQVQQTNQFALMYGMTDYYTDLFYMPEGYRAVTHILLEVDEALLTAYTDLQAAYEEQQLTLEEGGEVTGDLVTADEVENARLAIIASVQPKIDEINQKLAGGAAFNDLIPEYSMDTGMTTPEAIAEGYAVHMDSIMWDPVFTAAAFSVDTIGQVSQPVVGMYGVHLVHYDHDVTGGPLELTDELKAGFMTELLTNAKDEIYYGAIEQWVGEATIVYSDEAKAIMGLAE